MARYMTEEAAFVLPARSQVVNETPPAAYPRAPPIDGFLVVVVGHGTGEGSKVLPEGVESFDRFFSCRRMGECMMEADLKTFALQFDQKLAVLRVGTGLAPEFTSRRTPSGQTATVVRRPMSARKE